MLLGATTLIWTPNELSGLQSVERYASIGVLCMCKVDQHQRDKGIFEGTVVS